MGEGCRQSHDSFCVLIRLGKAWKAQTVAEGISGSHSVWGLVLVPSVLLLYLRFKDVSIGGLGCQSHAAGNSCTVLSCLSAYVCMHVCVRAPGVRKGSSIFTVFLPPPSPPAMLSGDAEGFLWYAVMS